jgi:regulator of nucleoside diphosphate kinase
MLVDVRHLDLPVSDALYDFTNRRVTRALRPFQEAVSRIGVRTRDVNGPRGGIDIECRMMVELAPVEQPVVVTSKGADAYAAIVEACARLREAVSRALERRRRIERSGVSPPEVAPRHTVISSGAEKAGGPEKAASGVGTVDQASDVVVTARDHERLRKLIQVSRDTRDRDAAEALADELDRAQVVPAERITGNVVTMNSRVVFQDEETGESREVSVVYPGDSDPEQGRISVLAPVGAALLGLSVGQTIDWPLPQGRLKRCRVVEVVYQPEAAGHPHL